jgi:transcriptional regulator with XRE-family HTH domain
VQDARVGSLLRAIRIRRGWRQVDLARAVGVSDSLISEIERGVVDIRQLRQLRAVAGALGASIALDVRWRGGDVDRLLNEAHTRLAEAVARHLETLGGWTFRPEVAFTIGPERGVIDLLALHRETRSLLIVEIKTELTDIGRLLETTSRRVRLGARIAADQGWPVATVSSWIVVGDVTANRRRAAIARSLLRASAPADGHAMRSWLSNPGASISALSFWSNSAGDGPAQRYAPRRRVARARASSQRARNSLR